jgi:predicted ATPase
VAPRRYGRRSIQSERLLVRAVATLEPHAETDLVRTRATLISSSLRLMESPRCSAREQLLASLRRRNLLLVLDNLEHLLDAGLFLAELVAECVEMSCLVTSTSGLRVRSEKRLALAPLEPTYAADLFVAPALAVNRDFGVQGSLVQQAADFISDLACAAQREAVESPATPPAREASRSGRCPH